MKGTEQLRPGAVIQLTEDGTRAKVWSLGPRPATYWCHLVDREGTPVVLVKVRNVQAAARPLVTVEETT